MIPRVERPLGMKVLGTVLGILITPIILAYVAVAMSLYFAASFLTLPWTLYFYSSNWSLSLADRKTSLEYAELVQTRNPTVVDMVRYIKPKKEKPPQVNFYPHEAEVFIGGIPFLMSVQGTTYTYPLISLVFMSLENAGWKREAVYDLFEQMISDNTGRQQMREVKKKTCRGEISAKMKNFIIFGMLRMSMKLVPKLLPFLGRAPNMLKADGRAIDMDMKDATWILSGHSIIHPKDKETLEALDTLNRSLGMWKFVTKEEDFTESEYWQFVVL